MNLTTLSTGIHTLKRDHVIRKDYIFSVKTYLDDNRIVFLEGDQDSGKTTICQEFCFENSTNSVSIFFNPFNKIDYNLDYFLNNVISQLRLYLGDQTDDILKDENFGIEIFQKLIHKVRKKTKKQNLYFVIDGLEENNEENNGLIKKIVEILPLGDENFHLLITGSQKEFLKKHDELSKLETRSLSVIGFSEGQIEEFFKISNVSVTGLEVKELRKITKGYPGKLLICKKLSDNLSIREIIETEFKKLIELECEKIDLEESNTNVLLSILSLKENSYTTVEITQILKLESDQLELLIKKIPVLEVKDNNIYFQSLNYKMYFKNVLRSNLKKVDDLLIAFLSSSETINSKLQLSEIYAENKQWGNLLTIIDEPFLANAFNSTESLKKVNNSIALAHTASLESKNSGQLFKFSIQGSIINDFEDIGNLESEIEARLAIKDFSGAITIAESTILRVNRLVLLSLIARKQKELDEKLDEDLINVIINLYKNTDFSDVGEKLYDIVANLMYVVPHLALEIIENSSSKSEENDINDWIIAKLSIASIKAENSSSAEGKSSNDKLLERIENNNSRKISKAVTFLVGNYNTSKVLDEVKKISDPKEKLRLLRIWLSNNKQNSDNVELVIESALDQLISASNESILSLEVLKDITIQLPYVKNIGVKNKLYQRFTKLDIDIKEQGLDKDKFVYELNLFHTLYTLARDKSIVKLGDILSDAAKIEDSLIKIEIYCEIYSKLMKINFPSFTKSCKEIRGNIKQLNQSLLHNSANHYTITKQYIKTLSQVDVDFCIELVSLFNTQKNRDRSRLHVLNNYLKNNLKHIDLKTLDRLYKSYETIFFQNHFHRYLFERLDDSKGLHFTIINYALKSIEKLDLSSLSFSNKIYCFVLLYRIVSKNEQIKHDKKRSLKQKIENYWNNIDNHWSKVNLGYFICSELAEVDNAFANNIFIKSNKLKNESWISSENTSKTYVNSLSIVIKSFIGLTILKVNNASHYKNLETLIDRIPSEVERLELWTELGFSLLLEKKLEIAQNVYNEHILPLLQGIISKQENYSSCLRALVFTHYYNSDLANDYIFPMDDLIKNEIYDSICEFYVTRKSPYEIYDGDVLNYHCSYNDFLKTVAVLEKISNDIFIYGTIDSIYSAISDKNNTLTPTQKRDIASKLLELVAKKLPDLKNISHNGYKIISEVKIFLITKNNTEWKRLYDESQLVPNLSDRILIKSNLLENVPFDKVRVFTKADLFDEIVVDLKNLNNHYEYIERIIETSETMYSTNKTRWKIIVEDAFSITKTIDRENISYKYQKSLIDTMFRLDPGFSKELLNSIENKDAKNELLRDHYMSLEISKKIKNNQSIEQKETENSRVVLRGVVNTLAAFNSGKLTIRKPDEINKYLNVGSKLPLKEALVLYHYYFANCNKHTPPKNSESKYEEFLLKLFEDTIKSTNLIEILSNNRKKKSLNIDFQDFSSNLPIVPGTREDAIKYIQEWINDEVEEYLVFADPYFGAGDIEFVKLLKQARKDNINVNILTHKYVEQDDIEKEWKKISMETIPYINITFCNVQNDNKCPFHDRWFITKNGGLRIGTSFNSIGISRDSEISVISANESQNIFDNILKGYIDRTKREQNFQKISYQSYSL